jgi:hypothetical protein
LSGRSWSITAGSSGEWRDSYQRIFGSYCSTRATIGEGSRAASKTWTAISALDLESILDGNLYNEFALAYRLLHRSRLPAEGDQQNKCLLEIWYDQGIEEGGRVRDRLRDGVKAALEILGSGFLGHPANTALRARLDSGGLTDAWLYRELLNLVCRLLFLMVAEERRLLFVPTIDTAARHAVYLRWYGIGRLRERAERRPPPFPPRATAARGEGQGGGCVRTVTTISG